MDPKVLVVDDNETLLQLVAASLKSVGQYEVLLARDGEDALAQAYREQPELMLLDIVIPKLDGYEVCRRIRAHPATVSTYVLMLSGLSDAEDIENARKAGADDYLVKPFRHAALLEKVEQALQGVRRPFAELARPSTRPASLEDLTQVQLGAYAEELHQQYAWERSLRQQVDERVRELEALNGLFQQQLDERFTLVEACQTLAETLTRLASQFAAVVEQAKLPPGPARSEPQALAADGPAAGKPQMNSGDSAVRAPDMPPGPVGRT